MFLERRVETELSNNVRVREVRGTQERNWKQSFPALVQPSLCTLSIRTLPIFPSPSALARGSPISFSGCGISHLKADIRN